MFNIEGSSKWEDLTDIRNVLIDPKLGKEERIMDFIMQIKNPYLFRCGNLVVQSVFADTDVTLTDRLKQYFNILMCFSDGLHD